MMGNPLFGLLGGGPMGNMARVMSQFGQFRSMFKGDPKAQVEQLLASGKMSREQFEQLKQMATQFQQMMNQS